MYKTLRGLALSKGGRRRYANTTSPEFGLSSVLCYHSPVVCRTLRLPTLFHVPDILATSKRLRRCLKLNVRIGVHANEGISIASLGTFILLLYVTKVTHSIMLRGISCILSGVFFMFALKNTYSTEPPPPSA